MALRLPTLANASTNVNRTIFVPWASHYLLRTSRARSAQISERSISQADDCRTIQRRAEAEGIRTIKCCHTVRGTGITEYLRNGGKLEIAQQMSNHESARTNDLYDHPDDQLTLDEVERILI